MPEPTCPKCGLPQRVYGQLVAEDCISRQGWQSPQCRIRQLEREYIVLLNLAKYLHEHLADPHKHFSEKTQAETKKMLIEVEQRITK